MLTNLGWAVLLGVPNLGWLGVLVWHWIKA